MTKVTWTSVACAGAVAILIAAGPVAAQSLETSVRGQLEAQGYDTITINRTWLGRMRVIATIPGESQREIVINPATGVILRDFTRRLDGDQKGSFVLPGTQFDDDDDDEDVFEEDDAFDERDPDDDEDDDEDDGEDDHDGDGEDDRDEEEGDDGDDDDDDQDGDAGGDDDQD